MRHAWLVLVCGCTQLDPMPGVDAGIEWHCADAFDQRWADCAHDDCTGVMAMQSLIDDSAMAFTSDQVRVERHHGRNGRLRHVRFYSVTDYFRGTVDISSIEGMPEKGSTSFVIRDGVRADLDDRAVRFEWSASNSNTPLVATGLAGFVQLQNVGEGLLATWLVVDDADESLHGCAYATTP